MTADPPQRAPRRVRRLASRVIGGEAVVVLLDGQRVLTLNPVGTFVFERVDGRPVEALAADVAEAFEVDLETATRDVRSFLDELARAGVLETPP